MDFPYIALGSKGKAWNTLSHWNTPMLDVSNWFHIAGALQGPAPLEESSTVPPRSAWLLSWW